MKTVLKVSTGKTAFIYFRYPRWLVDAIILSHKNIVIIKVFKYSYYYYIQIFLLYIKNDRLIN